MGGEVAHLVFTESEVLLALLEDDSQRPPHGIYSVGLPESHSGIGCDDAIPVGLFPALAEEEPHVVPGELNIHRYVVAAQLVTPTAPVLRRSNILTSCLAVCSLPLYMYFVLPILVMPG